MNYADILKYGLATKAYADSRDALALATAQAYTNAEIAKLQDVLDLGNISGAVNIDLSYSAIKFNLTGNATFTFINPPASGVNRPTTFYGTRSSGSNAVLTLPTVSWTSPQPPNIIDVYTTVFSVSTLNAGTSYFGFANGISLEVTGSGLATTWNPSDYALSHLTLNNNNLTLEMTTATGALSNANGRSARSFGGKSAGKWLYGLIVESLQSSTPGNGGYFGAGISSPANPVNSFSGLNLNSGCFMLMFEAGTRYIRTYDKNVLTTRAVITPAVGDIIVIALDADTGKGWVNYNGTWLYGGNPETGASPIFTIGTPNVFFPMNSFCELGTGNAGRYTLLNELQVIPVLASVPSYNYWNA